MVRLTSNCDTKDMIKMTEHQTMTTIYRQKSKESDISKNKLKPQQISTNEYVKFTLLAQ